MNLINFMAIGMFILGIAIVLWGTSTVYKCSWKTVVVSFTSLSCAFGALMITMIG